MENVDCPNCGISRHETVLVAEDMLTHLGGTFRIVRCCDCHLAFTNPRPTAESLNRFYPADYSPHHEKEPERAHGRWKRRLELALLRRYFGYPPQPTGLLTALASATARVVIRRTRTRERWIPFRAPGRLLDFGCGAGEFVKQMRDYGWNAEGLDFSPRMVDILRQKAEFRAHLGTLPHPDLPAASLDAVTMWHALEHVPFPQQVLQAAANTLRRRGVLGITVPNFDSWSLRQFQGDWFGLALPRHFTHFTPATLRRMIEAAGFRVLLVEQVGRDGWIRKSARNLAINGRGPKRLTRLRSKPLAALVARWTELTGQADSFRLVAEKR
jgi:2-polyprenyl-3-methyl-5-hydroxy-6-metoxy-1,4-benzoquinol methylase